MSVFSQLAALARLTNATASTPPLTPKDELIPHATPSPALPVAPSPIPTPLATPISIPKARPSPIPPPTASPVIVTPKVGSSPASSDQLSERKRSMLDILRDSRSGAPTKAAIEREEQRKKARLEKKQAREQAKREAAERQKPNAEPGKKERTTNESGGGGGDDGGGNGGAGANGLHITGDDGDNLAPPRLAEAMMPPPATPLTKPAKPPPPGAGPKAASPEAGAAVSSAGGPATPLPFAPQVKVVDGQLVIDPGSLLVTAEAPPVSHEDFDVVQETASSGRVTAASFAKRPRARRWSPEETERFYEGLRLYGTDFTLLARMFPGRDRRDLRTKYKREEINNPARLDATLRRQLRHTSEETACASYRRMLEDVRAEKARLLEEKARAEADTAKLPPPSDTGAAAAARGGAEPAGNQATGGAKSDGAGPAPQPPHPEVPASTAAAAAARGMTVVVEDGSASASTAAAADDADIYGPADQYGTFAAGEDEAAAAAGGGDDGEGFDEDEGGGEEDGVLARTGGGGDGGDFAYGDDE